MSKTSEISELEEEWLKHILITLTGQHFYGKLTLSIENGIITTIKKEETLKPPKP